MVCENGGSIQAGWDLKKGYLVVVPSKSSHITVERECCRVETDVDYAL